MNVVPAWQNTQASIAAKSQTSVDACGVLDVPDNVQDHSARTKKLSIRKTTQVGLECIVLFGRLLPSRLRLCVGLRMDDPRIHQIVSKRVEVRQVYFTVSKRFRRIANQAHVGVAVSHGLTIIVDSTPN